MIRAVTAKHANRGVRLLLVPVVAVTFFLAPFLAFAQSPTAPFTNFPNGAEAQQHCPGDTAVWLNLPSGVYHFAGECWYGRTKKRRLRLPAIGGRGRECGRRRMGSERRDGSGPIVVVA